MTLQYSEINFDNNINQTSDFEPLKPPKINNKNHNKTAKKSISFDMSELFEKIHKKDKLEEVETNVDENVTNNMGDFKPLPEFEPVQMVKPNNYTSNIANTENISLDEKVNRYNETYYENVPYEQPQMQKNNSSNIELLHKLNYIITLLEEQKDEKTNNVIEEVILYTFLGIFVIFIIDSFARASKYVR
jgi:hypothetical protein